MHTEVRDPWKNRKTLALPLQALAAGLLVLHVLVVILFPHTLLPSNIIQLCIPLLAVVVSFLQATFNPNRIGRHCWYAVAAAFFIWSAAQGLFLYFSYFPAPHSWPVHPDDALWVLFGFPLLLAVTATSHEGDRVAWLDRAQAILFFAVLYLLVFLPSGRLAVTTSYLIQNVTLVLCCLLRLPLCTLARERRFYVNLAVFLFAYSTLESLGETLYRRGWRPGSAVDLVWSLPVVLFIFLTLRDALNPPHEGAYAGRFLKAMRAMQGLSAAVMTFLSIGVAALLATRRPMVGGLFVAGAFFLFALRTNARERLWNQAHKQLEETVLRDSLTGLGNRLQLRRCLAELLDTKEPGTAALLFVDLDRFKQINDSLGHALGDRLLIEAGRRLRASSPAESDVCRLGGDEFVVLMAACDTGDAETVAVRLLHEMRAPFYLAQHEVHSTASIGVVIAEPGEKADDLLRTADHAMYRAKQLGKNRVQLFDASMRDQMSTRWHMEAELRMCIERSEIQVAFQPIYSVEQGSICGFEALARWDHATLGKVPPVQFITLAEDTGLILALGNQILEKACSQMARWNVAWGTAFSLSVNVSPRQFADANLMPSLLVTLEKTGFPPSLLRLEITETALLTHESIVKQTLEQARAHGIRISLDDFGTGYSSLSFLLSLPVDEVKVDRTFVSHMHQDPDRAELVRTVIHLGHSLGKRVVAEGVETEQDLLGLAEMGCECVQGYLISKPLFPAAVETDLASIAARSMSAVMMGCQDSLRGRKFLRHPATAHATFPRIGSPVPLEERVEA